MLTWTCNPIAWSSQSTRTTDVYHYAQLPLNRWRHCASSSTTSPIPETPTVCMIPEPVGMLCYSPLTTETLLGWSKLRPSLSSLLYLHINTTSTQKTKWFKTQEVNLALKSLIRLLVTKKKQEQGIPKRADHEALVWKYEQFCSLVFPSSLWFHEEGQILSKSSFSFISW